MAKTGGAQVAFGWVGSTEPPPTEPRAVRSPKGKASAPQRGAAKPGTPPAKVGEPELPPDNELWDVHAAARFLRRSVSWVYHKAEDGTLPVTRLGGWGLRFIPGDLRAWVASGAPRRR